MEHLAKILSVALKIGIPHTMEEVKTVRPLEHLLITLKINRFSEFCNSLLILKNYWPNSTDGAARVPRQDRSEFS
jgi:hypothetical protein